MKPYFAKYLPIEGEIKEGDLIYCTSYNRKRGVGKVISIDHKIEIFNVQFLKLKAPVASLIKDSIKVELFLCSRDIKVGDTFIDSVGRKWENAEECWVKAANEGNNHGGDFAGSYKIIGKISPDAKWIKERDEFDEDEIEKVYKKQFECLCEKPNVYRTKEQANCEYMVDDHRGGDFCIHQINVLDYIKLKGQCGHFH